MHKQRIEYIVNNINKNNSLLLYTKALEKKKEKKTWIQTKNISFVQVLI